MDYVVRFDGNWSFDKLLTCKQIEEIAKFINGERKNRKIQQYTKIEFEDEISYMPELMNPDQIFEIGYSQLNDGPIDLCQWEISNNKLSWNGNINFFYHMNWLCYLIDKYFNPWDVKLNGEVRFDEPEQQGNIKIIDNDVYRASVYYDNEICEFVEREIMIYNGKEFNRNKL